MRKSSSTTSYSLTSHVDFSDDLPSTSSRSKLHVSHTVLPGRYSHHGTAVEKGGLVSGLASKPAVPSLTKSSSWPQRPAVARDGTAMPGTQR